MKTLRLLLAMLAMGYAVLPIQATTITVTNLADSGAGSLRQAILASASGGTVDFAVTGTIGLTSGELGIGRDLTITGPGAANLVINGRHTSRVFNIGAGAHVDITGLTISSGYVLSATSTNDARGGGILNSGVLSVASCLIVGSSTEGASASLNSFNGLGGGVYNASTLALNGCTLSQNSAVGGGSVSSYSGGYGYGGGVASAGALAMTNCTVSGNSARGGTGVMYGGGGSGGGLWVSATNSWVVNCTVSGNACYGESGQQVSSGNGSGGGIAAATNFVIVNTIVADNSSFGGTGFYPGTAYGPDVYRTAMSLGFNLIGKTNDSSGWVATDQTGSKSFPLLALLGSLQDNGGPTPTMLPQADSAAIDNGRNFGLITDQRGLPRLVDIADYPNAAGGDGSDIGACEVQALAADIGLRAYDGTATIKIACESGNSSSPMRIAKNGMTYGIVLVATNDAGASKIRIPTSSGVKALRKLP